jgi:hypothetical protein
MATRKRRAKKIGEVDIPRSANQAEILKGIGRGAATSSREPIEGVTPAVASARRSVQLRQGRRAASSLIAGTIAANRAVEGRRPASPEEKRGGSITPSTQPQATAGNGTTPASIAQSKTTLIQKSPEELKRLEQRLR